MKKLILYVVFCILSCSNGPRDLSKTVYIENPNIVWAGNSYSYQTVVIDSCEYVYIDMGYASWGSHKGNCKFCEARKEHQSK
jgi:hypothetical protein